MGETAATFTALSPLSWRWADLAAAYKKTDHGNFNKHLLATSMATEEELKKVDPEVETRGGKAHGQGAGLVSGILSWKRNL